MRQTRLRSAICTGKHAKYSYLPSSVGQYPAKILFTVSETRRPKISPAKNTHAEISKLILMGIPIMKMQLRKVTNVAKMARRMSSCRL